MERGVLVGVSALRAALWLWVAVLTIINLDGDRHPVVAVAAVTAIGAATAAAAIAPRGRSWRRALTWPFVVGELAAGAFALVADAAVGQGRRTGVDLTGNWPIAGIIVAATATGPVGGAAAGAGLGTFGLIAVALDPPVAGRMTREIIGAVSAMLVWMAVGAATGWIVRVVNATRDELAEVRAREDVARRLHDGVLQVLALVERRTTDPELARIAREQDLALRAYLVGDHERPDDLGAALRAIAAELERNTGVRVRLSLSDDLPELSQPVLEAVVGAVGEALTNASKHGHAAEVVVFADEADDEGLEVSVKDDGAGFDPAAVHEGFGMARSIRGRIADVGGTVEVRSTPGDGAEISLWLPTRASMRA